ncbi:MAG: glycosyltransferase [Bacteroidota bacterium]
MKIVLVGPAHPLRGGIANFNEALAKAFINAGHQCVIYSFSLQYPKLLFPGKTQFDNGPAPKNLTIKTVINSINPLNWISVAAQIKNEKPDIVIVRFWLPFMAMSLGTICRLLKSKTKIIAITDNVIPHEKRIGDNQLISYFIKSCHGFVVMSKAVLNDLSEFTNNTHKKFIPHPIYDIFGDKVAKKEARDFLKINQEAKVVLFFGFIRKYKGLDILLEAMANAELKKQNITLLIAGEFYEDEKPYLDIIEKHTLKNQIILHSHYIPSSDVKYYFCAADIVAQTYKTATQSGVTQIAYHFERPMLVTNVGGLAEIVPDGRCGYVTETNPQSVANALNEFYTQNKEQQMQQNVATDKANFSWKAMVDGILDLRKEI